MNFIILSGGSGQRLWPLSNDIRSKQFIPILKNELGYFESMICRVYQQIRSVDRDANIVVATGKRQVSTILHQLGSKVSICVEPSRRDTFPAIALAAAFLVQEKNVPEDEVVVVCPVDPYVNLDYFQTVKKLYERALISPANLCLMGVEPTFPSTKYGYIIPENQQALSRVRAFKEKPTREKAVEYIAHGALWNCGVFAFKLKYLLGTARGVLGTDHYLDLYTHYNSLTKVSFDYAIVEREENIEVLRFKGDWIDIGTWNTLIDVMKDPSIGDVTMDDDCVNTHVVNTLSIPILCMGLSNIIVAASNDGILVSEREHSALIKPFVEKLESQARFAEKSWGSFTVLDIDGDTLTAKLLIQRGKRFSYHSHKLRSEVWTIISGVGVAVINGESQELSAGDTLAIPVGCKHTLEAITELQVIEVQVGATTFIIDKVKHESNEAIYGGRGERQHD